MGPAAGLNAVERTTVLRTIVTVHEFDGRHDSNAVESDSVPLTSGRLRPRFNGATASQPWKQFPISIPS